MQKIKNKEFAISFVIILVVNILILSIVDFCQISYWKEAPEEELIYNMIVGENKNNIEFLYNDTNLCISDEDVNFIETALKDTYAIKLSKKESYKMLSVLNEKNFALYCTVYDKDYSTIKNITEPVSQLWLYLYDNSIYIVRATDERQTDSSKVEYAVYKAEEKSELFDILNSYVDESGDGIFYFTIPEWRNNAGTTGIIYLAIVIWEVSLAGWLLKKKRLKGKNKIDK